MKRAQNWLSSCTWSKSDTKCCRMHRACIPVADAGGSKYEGTKCCKKTPRRPQGLTDPKAFNLPVFSSPKGVDLQWKLKIGVGLNPQTCPGDNFLNVCKGLASGFANARKSANATLFSGSLANMQTLANPSWRFAKLAPCETSWFDGLDAPDLLGSTSAFRREILFQFMLE